MATNTNVDYNAEKGGYYKVLVGLLLLTTITFVQPTLFSEGTFAVQMFIGLVKAWLILMYYMHLKGEKLIGYTVGFAVILVVYFFLIVIIDVNAFQFGDASHIVTEAQSGVTTTHVAH
jgi:caa(3)-type oxidase subunit IV